MKLSDYAKKHSVTYRTAWNHWKSGKLAGTQLSTGTIVVDDAQTKHKNIAVIYSRVSSSQNKQNLESQAQRLTQYATAKGYQIKRVIKEIGSGVNDTRKLLTKLLQEEDYSILIVEHKDRLTRIGFNYLDTLMKQTGRTIEVVNLTDGEKEGLMQDFVSIITSFCARLYGLRRTRRKTEKIIKALERSDG